MCSTDYDLPDLYDRFLVKKSRKEHKCSECYRTIEKSESYSKIIGTWNGDFQVFKTCMNCLVFQDWLLEECGDFMHGDLDEELEEHAFGYKKIFLYRGVVGMRRKWKNKKGNLMKPVLIKESK